MVQVSAVPRAAQAPVHPRKVCFFAGFAVNVTSVPTVKHCAHCLPQLIPFGLLLTDPDPVTLTVNWNFWVAGTNVAMADRLAVMSGLQVPVPLQSPLQPVKTLPTAGVAVSETAVPSSSRTEHAAPQLMPLPVT